jgi:hypothetical protein
LLVGSKKGGVVLFDVRFHRASRLSGTRSLAEPGANVKKARRFATQQARQKPWLGEEVLVPPRQLRKRGRGSITVRVE